MNQLPAWLREPLRAPVGVMLAALHDVGKVSPGFQVKCADWAKEHGLSAAQMAGSEADHAKVSQKVVQDVLDADPLRFWAAIVGAHHGKLKGDRLAGLCDGGEGWAVERQRLADDLIQKFGPLPAEPPPHPDRSFDCASLWFNAGLIVVADWLASDDGVFPPSKQLDDDAIRKRAETQLERTGFRISPPQPGMRFSEIFPFPPNEMQVRFEEVVKTPGVYVLEAGMGSGKTEAALMVAYNLLAGNQATGIYFALPTQVTSNRIHQRVQAFLERVAPAAGVRLIHSNSWLFDVSQAMTGAEFGEDAREWVGRDWFASPRRALLAPFGVGTVDQALLGVVAAKHFFVRQYGLAGKVVILDEVHSYDLYTGTLLDQLVRRLRELGATVIVLSATLTAARRNKLLGAPEGAAGSSAYPLLSGNVAGHIHEWPVQPDPPKTVKIQFRPQAELADACLERAEGGECVLWIRNTVNDAQDTYRRLCGQNRVGGPDIGLLHSRFPMFRRHEIEEMWLDRLGKEHGKRPAGGCILVSTQIAEQSVDIDADLLITDPAPTDMLLQRIGRLWRHARLRPPGCREPAVWIAMPDMDVPELRTASVAEIKAALSKSSKVYAPYVLLRTLALLRERHEIAVPQEIRPLLEATYAEPQDPEPAAWRVLMEELEARKTKLGSAAIGNSNPWQVQLDDREDIQTRWISCPTAGIVIVRRIMARDFRNGARLELLGGEECAIKAGEYVYAAAQAMNRNVVKAPRWTVSRHLGSNPPWLREYVRGDVMLCKLVGDDLVALPGGEATGLSYRDDLGVVIPCGHGSGVAAGLDIEEYDDESYD